MGRWMLAVAACGVGMLALGVSPRYLEELRIGGGCGDEVNGGANLDSAGNIATDGRVVCGSVASTGGLVEAGRDGVVRGMLSAWDGFGGLPGCLRLGAPNGVFYYLFASSDGAGLRISAAEPTSNESGQWLRAQTVADLSAPPAVGSSTPNTGAFTALTATGEFRAGDRCSFGTMASSVGRFYFRRGDSGYRDTRNFRTQEGMIFETDLDGVLLLQSPSASELWFGDGSSESRGRIRYEHATDLMRFYAGWASRATLNGQGDFDLTGDLVCEGGDVRVGTVGSVRGVLSVVEGGGGNTPGALRISSANGTSYYVFVQNDGTLKVTSILPSSNSDGVVAGEQFARTVVVFTGNDTTPSVAGGRVFRFPDTWTVGHNVTMLDDGVVGQVVVLIGGDSDCTVVDGGHLKLVADWVAASDRTLSLVFDGLDWFETSRSAN